MSEKDIVSKDILKRLAVDIARLLLHLKVDRAEIVETEYQRIEDRRADLVAEMEGEEGRFLLHVEIQNGNDPRMAWRMLRYRAEIGHARPEADIRQYLIYIGREPLAMADGIRQQGLDYRYGILDMRRVDCAGLIAQDNPDALVLAILCDFKDRPAREVVHYILARLRALLSENESRFREYVRMLEILSTNRDLEHVLEEEEKMLSQVELTRLPSYRLGIEQGIEQGIERGSRQEALQMLERLLARRFGPLDEAVCARLRQASRETLERWAERLFDAQSIDDVFDGERA